MVTIGNRKGNDVPLNHLNTPMSSAFENVLAVMIVVLARKGEGKILFISS